MINHGACCICPEISCSFKEGDHVKLAPLVPRQFNSSVGAVAHCLFNNARKVWVVEVLFRKGSFDMGYATYYEDQLEIHDEPTWRVRRNK